MGPKWFKRHVVESFTPAMISMTFKDHNLGDQSCQISLRSSPENLTKVAHARELSQTRFFKEIYICRFLFCLILLPGVQPNIGF